MQHNIRVLLGILKCLKSFCCNHRAEIGKVSKCALSDDSAVTVWNNGIVALSGSGMILNGPLESFVAMLIPQLNSTEQLDQNFVFSFLLSSRIFIQPHDLLRKIIESVSESDESLERMVVLMKEWTRCFPYDFRCEEIMSLVKHIVARCETNTPLADKMSDILSALLIKLTDLSQHEEEMKAYKKPLDEQRIIEWPNSPTLAQLLCFVEKKFAKHIGPEEFIQCSSNLIKDQTNISTTSASYPSSTSSSSHHHHDSKKKTCNLENYFEWSHRLRLMVANEILQCTNVCDLTSKIELWSSVAQHCLLVGNYNSATSILEPICHLQAVWKRFMSSTNQQQLDCMFKHIESSPRLNLWSKQTMLSSCSGISKTATLEGKRGKCVTADNLSLPLDADPSIIKVPQQQHKAKWEWVVLPVFIDILRSALKAREECCERLPNGSINLCAFNELAVIVSAFTNHISNVPISASSHIDELNYLVNHILTCPLRDENEFFTAFEKQAHKIESYYDIP